MKNLFFLCLISLCAITQTKSQKRDNHNIINNYKIDSSLLSLKSRTQQKTARILVGSGFILAGVGIWTQLNYLRKRTSEDGFFWDFTGAKIAIAGVVFSLSSIPFFLISSKTKKRITQNKI